MKRAKQNNLQRKRNIHRIDDGLGQRKVYLDGALVEKCIGANIRRGFVIRYKVDKRGYVGPGSGRVRDVSFSLRYRETDRQSGSARGPRRHTLRERDGVFP